MGYLGLKDSSRRVVVICKINYFFCLYLIFYAYVQTFDETVCKLLEEELHKPEYPYPALSQESSKSSFVVRFTKSAKFMQKGLCFNFSYSLLLDLFFLCNRSNLKRCDVD